MQVHFLLEHRVLLDEVLDSAEVTANVGTLECGLQLVQFRVSVLQDTIQVLQTHNVKLVQTIFNYYSAGK